MINFISKLIEGIMSYNIEKKREATRLRVQRFRAKQKGENVKTKICLKCGDEKAITEFGNHWRTRDSLQPWCRKCQSIFAEQRNHSPKETTPKLGEIRLGKKIGKSPSAYYMWQTCEVCHKPRWVQTSGGKPTSTRCRECGHRAMGLVTDEEIYQAGESEIDPMQNLDNFFDHIGLATTEIKYLRREVANLKDSNNRLIEAITTITQERDNWKSRAAEWSEKLVELQNILTCPSRTLNDKLDF